MTMDQVLSYFEERGVDARIKHLVKDGVTQTCFGVPMADLRTLAKKIKRNHALGLGLWKSKYYEAMLLACMIMDGSLFSEDELHHMVEEINHWLLIDFFVRYVVLSSPELDIVSKKWMNHSCFLVGRAGWMIEVEKIINRIEPVSNYEALLDDIKHKMKYAPVKKQEVMNRMLVEIATRKKEHYHQAIEIATTIGPLDDKPVKKGCISTYAPIWIASILEKKDNT